MPDPAETTNLAALPRTYAAPQEVDLIGGAPREDRMKHHPHVYLCTDRAAGTCSLAVASEHGLGAFYSFVQWAGNGTRATAQYRMVAGPYDPGCMLHGINDRAGIPGEVAVEVAHGGTTERQVVTTVHADDKSAPPVLPYATAVPMCHVENDGGDITVHGLVYVENTGLVVDLAAAARATFTRHYDAQGRFVDWRLEVPMTPGLPSVLQRVSFAVGNAAGQINPGEVVRVKLPDGNLGPGRSFAFVWPAN